MCELIFFLPLRKISYVSLISFTSIVLWRTTKVLLLRYTWILDAIFTLFQTSCCLVNNYWHWGLNLGTMASVMNYIYVYIYVHVLRWPGNCCKLYDEHSKTWIYSIICVVNIYLKINNKNLIFSPTLYNNFPLIYKNMHELQIITIIYEYIYIYIYTHICNLSFIYIIILTSINN